MNFSKITALTEDEIKLFKDDPETFREYLKFKTRQIEIANDIDTKNHEERMKELDIEHEERMKAFDINLEENDRKRKAEAEENDKRRTAEAEARESEMRKIVEANDRREKIWAMAICGVGALCEFLDQKNSNDQNENDTFNKQIESINNSISNESKK